MDPRESLEKFVRWVMRDVLYLRNFAATVEGQHDDDTLDLLPDDERVRGTGLSRVPIRHGLPGVRVRVPVGARVLLGFEAGDPTRPFAHLWDPGSIESLSFDGGEAPIARAGDPVACYWPASVPFTATLAGNAFVGAMTIGTPGAGIIQSGAARVKA